MDLKEKILDIFFIVFGLILALLLIGYFSKSQNTSSTKKSASSSSQVSNHETSGSTSIACGLTVLSPISNQKISGASLSISGIANGCGWIAFEGEAGTVEVRNSSGVLVSPVVPLHISGEWMNSEPHYFNADLSITNTPNTTLGKVIFKNEDPSGSNPLSYEVPIQF